MQPLWRRLVVLFVALAFITGGVVGVTVPHAAAGQPCTEGHGQADHHAGGHQHGKKPPQQNSGQRACLQCCCVGICASVPNLPTALTSERLTMTLVAYWDTARLGVGRSVKPEHGPPRPLA
jgi:hypothetical protein